MRLTDGTRFARAALAGDLIALPMFVVVGMGSHRTGAQIAIFLRNTVPVVLAWLVAARFLATYRPPAFTSMFATWAVAVPVGIVIRSLIAGRLDDDGFFVFLGVAMAFTLLFLGVGRGVVLSIVRPWRAP
jgi:hypothetical protein